MPRAPGEHLVSPGRPLASAWWAPDHHLVGNCRAPVRDLSGPVWPLACTWLARVLTSRLPQPHADPPSTFARCEELTAWGSKAGTSAPPLFSKPHGAN